MPRAPLRHPSAVPVQVPEAGPAASAGLARCRCERSLDRRYRLPIERITRRRRRQRRRRRRGRCHGCQRIRRRSAGNGAGRQRRALYRREDPVVEVDAIIGRDALRDQIRVERVRTRRVFAHGQRLIPFRVVAEFDCGRAFSGVSHARVVAGAAHRERRVLRQFAVQIRPVCRWW